MAGVEASNRFHHRGRGQAKMTLEPVLFSSNRRLVGDLAGSGSDSHQRVSGVIVDWERIGKSYRQRGALALMGTDTQIGTDTPGDLAAVASLALVPVTCRINSWYRDGLRELDLAVELGADEVLLPMVRTVAEVEEALDHMDGRGGVGILIETREAVSLAPELAALPLSSVYVGLMDLAIDTDAPSIFRPMVDGTVERLRGTFETRFGVAGLTVPSGGAPVPGRILAAELVRLGCDFSFLRRSFIRDAGDDPSAALNALRSYLMRLASRSSEEVVLDHAAFVEAASSTWRQATA